MIPRVIHHIWVGPPMPGALKAYRATWVRLHPEWDDYLWDEAALDDFGLVNRDLYDRAEELAPGSEGQFRSDIARYEILERLGGVYVDCDMEALRPIDTLVDVGCFAAWEDTRWVNNAVLGCTPGHRLMRDAIARIPISVAKHRGKRPNKMTGPQMLTPLIGRDVTVYPSSWFYPYRWDALGHAGGPFPEAFAVHHWANRRKRDGVDLPAPREVTCLTS